MNKQERTEQENRDLLRSSEFYNRPGSTEHNDYRISGGDKKLPVQKKDKMTGDKDPDKNTAAQG